MSVETAVAVGWTWLSVAIVIAAWLLEKVEGDCASIVRRRTILIVAAAWPVVLVAFVLFLVL